MDECTKSKKIWGDLEWSILEGTGIDIGCGPDPVTATCKRFDMEHGDANQISKFVKEQFDFVYSSHCLEHMHQPKETIMDWWKLVKQGGYLFFSVPDEDLYEQGVFPSRFNPDHKATFTISKHKSWSDRSINVLDLALSLPNSKIVKLELQDTGYDRSYYRHGQSFRFNPYNGTSYRKRIKRKMIDLLQSIKLVSRVVDQTQSGALAQITCIVQKIPAPISHSF